ncbi:cytidine deaminase [Cantharellus anzutake]|uniref:cytidine deaminase n=1 Tax=Cantharellus anzutake TaxID=1750568 RepID=UPI0019084F2E|nr:cytidine deaminase [Cantharellus anzutake]KAF8329362.1 cytidine deaminase [Cantharellus anzutake]
MLSSEQRSQLISAAFEAREKSYSPYSKFRVGASLLAATGQIIKGQMLRMLAMVGGGTICAERTALVKAVSDGIKDFVALAVITDVNSAVSPCGICRQFIREFCSLKMPVLLVPGDYKEKSPNGPEDGSGKVVEIEFEKLLPLSFGPGDLELPRGPPE